MGKGRIEAFSDGVIAILITIMVLEMKVPHGSDFAALGGLLPVFLSYILSFVYIAIYWNNHHHLFHAIKKVDGKILWANMHLLFWLSLLPFATGWMGENGFASLPVVLYGFILLMSGIAYYILTHCLISHHGKDSIISRAIGNDRKGKLSLFLYAVAIPVAFKLTGVSMLIYMTVALIWILPDRRIEKIIDA